MGRRDEGKEEFWRAAVAEHRQSGLLVREFCKQRQLVENSFYAWRRELKRRDQEFSTVESENTGQIPARAKRKRTASAFLPVEVLSASSQLLEVVLPSRVTIRVPAGFDRETLAEVLSLLERAAC